MLMNEDLFVDGQNPDNYFSIKFESDEAEIVDI